MDDGIGRLIDAMNGSLFTFVVLEQRFASNVAEAICLSPTIHQLIQTDITLQ
jgi:hypothetical protein